ncbi:MAG: hypothetical protein PHI79_04030, partial [Sulfurovaceae bacterium]|nr:hypothetical protein [Sulfurovaceae bacterium]
MKILKLFLFLLISFNISFAKNNLVGSYTNRTVDTISHLAILPDKTFCFSYMGGNLDLLLAGNWKMQGDNIILQEVRQPQDMYIVIGLSESNTKDRVVKISGRTLSYATGTIFGISEDDKMPKMKLILEENYNGFYENYPFALSNNKNENIFIGFPIKYFADDKIEYKIYSFKLDTPNANSFRVFFNRDAIRHNFELNATFKNNKLILDGAINSYEGFAKDNESLDKKSIAKIKQNCIDPVFAQKTNSNNSLL